MIAYVRTCFGEREAGRENQRGREREGEGGRGREREGEGGAAETVGWGRRRRYTT